MLPVGVPRSIRATTAGCVSTSAGSILRAFEDTNTSRQTTVEPDQGAARPGDVKSRGFHSATGTLGSQQSPPLGRIRLQTWKPRRQGRRGSAVRLKRLVLGRGTRRAPAAAADASGNRIVTGEYAAHTRPVWSSGHVPAGTSPEIEQPRRSLGSPAGLLRQSWQTGGRPVSRSGRFVSDSVPDRAGPRRRRPPRGTPRAAPARAPCAGTSWPPGAAPSSTATIPAR